MLRTTPRAFLRHGHHSPAQLPTGNNGRLRFARCLLVSVPAGGGGGRRRASGSPDRRLLLPPPRMQLRPVRTLLISPSIMRASVRAHVLCVNVCRCLLPLPCSPSENQSAHPALESDPSLTPSSQCCLELPQMPRIQSSPVLAQAHLLA